MKNMVALFLMNEDEKINYFRDYLSVWSSNYDSYLVKFNALYEESLKYKDSAKSKYLDYCERLHSLFLNMQRCDDFIKIYYILIDNIYNSASYAP